MKSPPLIAVILFFLPLLCCGGATPKGAAFSPNEIEGGGTSLPSTGSIPAISLERVDGKGKVQLQTFCRNKVVIVFFWATWCDSCKREIVGLRSVYDDLVKEGIDVLGVSMDTPETASEVQAEVYQYRMPFTVVFDTESRASAALNPAAAAPFTVVIDRNMRIVFSHEGFLSGDLERIRKVAMDARGR